MCLLCGTDWVFIYNSGLSWPQFSPCEICGGQGGTGTGFSPRTPTSVFCYNYHSTIAPSRRTNRPNLGTFHKVILFRKSWSTEWTSIHYYSKGQSPSHVFAHFNIILCVQIWISPVFTHMPFDTTIQNSFRISCEVFRIRLSPSNDDRRV